MIRAFVIVLSLLLFGCETTTQPTLESAVQQYKLLAPQKALAYGGNRYTGWVAASSSPGMPDLESARRMALSKCNERAFTAGVIGGCSIVYENDDFVGSGKEHR
jgi:hypothetical protein